MSFVAYHGNAMNFEQYVRRKTIMSISIMSLTCDEITEMVLNCNPHNLQFSISNNTKSVDIDNGDDINTAEKYPSSIYSINSLKDKHSRRSLENFCNLDKYVRRNVQGSIQHCVCTRVLSQRYLSFL